MDKEQLLYQYFSDSLTPEQEEQFNLLLSSDKQFKAQFDFEQDLQKVIKDKEGKALKDKLKGFEANLKQEEKPVIKLNFRKWAMAASIALLVGLGWLSYNNMDTNYDSLYDSNFEQYPNTVVTITRGDSSVSIEKEAFAAYELGNYERALLVFDKIPENDKKEYLAFYQALSYLKLNKLDNAMLLFKTVIANNNDFVGEAHWYLALTYIKNNQIQAAKKELQVLVDNYTYKKEKALTLLKELN